jgi:tetratricopeptide (TPR) repeat protein
MNRHRIRLAWSLAAWLVFAYAMGEVASTEFFQEFLDEGAALPGLGWLDHVPAFALTMGTVLLPLFLILHCNGGTITLARKLTPRGRALERNQAGMALFQQGGYIAAIAEFTEALRLQPQLAAAYTNRGIAYSHLDRLEEALADLNTALRLVPDLRDALAWRGQLWLRKGDSDKALTDYNAALRIDPAHQGVLTQRALLWARRRDYVRALEDCNRAMALGARAATDYAFRGSILLAKEEYDRAFEDLTEAILRGDRSAATFCNRGMVHLEKGDCDRAIADFEEAMRLDPDEGLVYNNRGAALLKRGDYAQAQADFHEARRLAPTLPNPCKNLAWLLATCPQAEFRDGAKAVAYAKQALELAGQTVIEWLAILAAAHAEAGDFAEAVRWQTQCLEQSPPQAKAEMQGRLDLYQANQPYRDRPAHAVADGSGTGRSAGAP